MTNHEILIAKRAEYMGRKIGHQEYYRWLGDFIGVTPTHLPRLASDVAVRECSNDSLNNIPLHYWDDRHIAVRELAYDKGLSWSLSDTVCTLKALAVELYRT